MDMCAVCGIKATQVCSACKSIKYCGSDHQRSHWQVHKLECRPFLVSTAPDVGRYLLATRDISAKTVIFTETPLVVGPKWVLIDQEEYNTVVPCVGCFAPVLVSCDGLKCPKCKWPVCSTTCSGLDNPKLHSLECPILALGLGPTVKNDLKSLMDYYRIDALVALKCLVLQTKFRKKWNNLMDMQSNESERLNSELYQDAERRIVSYLQNNYLNRLKTFEAQTNTQILTECDSITLHKICGIIETNYMCINLPNGLELSGLYYTACMMEHACTPNCYFTFDYKNGFKISVTAGRDIKKGEHLQIMYSNMLWGTQLRQEHLYLTKHFLCKCARCCDKTELGTYFSGLCCIGSEGTSCDGIQLPEDPLSQTTDWICNKCPMKINSQEVRYLMTQMGEEVETLIANKPTIRQLESLIDKLSKFLHKNHYHLFNIKHSLIQLYGSEADYLLNQLPDELLLRKMTLCGELIDICDKLDPYTIRLSLYVGIILKELFTATIEFNKRKLNGAQNEEEKNIALTNTRDAAQLLERAKEVLKKELDTLEGSKLNEAIIELVPCL